MQPNDLIDIILSNPKKYEREIDKMLASNSLVDYIEVAWHVLEPSVQFSRGWHIDCVADHLTAVTNGEINRLLINVPPGSCKPVFEDTIVVTDNRVKKLKDVVIGDKILSHNGKFCAVEAVHVQGDLPTLCVKTHNGRELILAYDHPVLTTRGWVQAKDLTTDDSVAIVHQQDEGIDLISPEEARFLGYLVGDGSVSQPNCLKFTNNNRENLDDFVLCCQKLGIHYSVKLKRNQTYDVTIKASSKPWRVSTMGPNPLHELLKKHDLLGKDSYTKRIPNLVMSSSKNIIRNFIGAYWSCDGYTKKRIDTEKNTYKASCTTVSKQLAVDILDCLARIGIDCYLRTKQRKFDSIKQPGGIYTSYDVVASDQDNVAKFKELPICREKLDCIEKAVRLDFDNILFADKIEEISESGLKPCRCLTVADDHSFVANGIAVHNSLLTSVFWPSWEWGPKKMPWNQFLTFSYSKKLALRDNIKCRTLIKSPFYQERWGDVFKLSTDVKAKEKFGNDKNGFKEISSVGGTGTGLRGDRVIIDDPHSVKQGDSDTQLKTAITWFNETLPTRLNDQKKSAIVVIMQRINEGDISGEIISKNLGYTHVMIPMYFEPERKCYTVVWPGGHKNEGKLYEWDKRTFDGELMWPEKFPEEEVKKLAAQLGSYGVAGQMQQRPVPREGAMFKQADVQIIPAEKVPEGIDVRGWDLAGSTSSKSPFSAGVKLRFDKNDNFYVMDVVRFRGQEKRVVDVMRSTAEQDGAECVQDFPQDPGQAGKGQATYITEQLFGFPVKYSTESGNKTIRAEAAASQASIKKMFIVDGPWNENFIKELTTFPGCRFKDQVDAMSRAFHRGLTMRSNQKDDIPAAPVSI